MLPILDGIEVIKIIKNMKKGVDNFIIISAIDSEELTKEVEDKGLENIIILQKPIALSTMKTVLEYKNKFDEA